MDDEGPRGRAMPDPLGASLGTTGLRRETQAPRRTIPVQNGGGGGGANGRNISFKLPQPAMPDFSTLKRTQYKTMAGSYHRSHSRTSKGKYFKVVVRLRPPVPQELEVHAEECLVVENSRVVRITEVIDPGAKPSSMPTEVAVHGFKFDQVYDKDTTQDELYGTAIKPVVESVLEGYNGSVIAYGQTGTGKTYTMEGRYDDDRGVIPRASEAIFHYIENSNSGSKFLVRISFLEVYNERVYDLLVPTGENLRVREDAKRGVYVEGLSEHIVRNPEDIHDLMRRGSAVRATGCTKANAESSRSHAVFTIVLERSVADAGEVEPVDNKCVIVGKLNLVDLAGSEKLPDLDNGMTRLEECKKINLSLTAFGKVILALTASGEHHTPYRDSKLTRILQDSLGGNCKTTLITTVTPMAPCFAESLNSLKFAYRAKSVKNYAVVNKDHRQEAMLSAYVSELDRLRMELASIKVDMTREQEEKEKVARDWEQVQQEKNAIVTELQQSSRVLVDMLDEKSRLETRIKALENKLLTGGTRIQETREFQEALVREQERMRREYEAKFTFLEAERQRIEREKDFLRIQLERLRANSESGAQNGSGNAPLSPVSPRSRPLEPVQQHQQQQQHHHHHNSNHQESQQAHHERATVEKAEPVQMQHTQSNRATPTQERASSVSAAKVMSTTSESTPPQVDVARSLRRTVSESSESSADEERDVRRQSTGSAAEERYNAQSLSPEWVTFVDALKDPITGIPLSDRRGVFGVFKAAFSGRDAFEYFTRHVAGVTSDDQVMLLGQAMIKMGVIDHYKGSKTFSTSPFDFYQFRGMLDARPTSAQKRSTTAYYGSTSTSLGSSFNGSAATDARSHMMQKQQAMMQQHNNTMSTFYQPQQQQQQQQQQQHQMQTQVQQQQQQMYAQGQAQRSTYYGGSFSGNGNGGGGGSFEQAPESPATGGVPLPVEITVGDTSRDPTPNGLQVAAKEVDRKASR
eukprot:Opistho-2@94559